MGAWGTALFSDDTACDVRDSYVDLVGDGLTGTEATHALLREWSTALNDSYESPVFWLALAATQRKCGRPEPRVLQQALNVIDSGSDLARWESDSKDFKKRKVVSKSSALNSLLHNLPKSESPNASGIQMNGELVISLPTDCSRTVS